jgi:hypothetical protein
VALDDAERSFGTHNGTVRALARAVRERLRAERAPLRQTKEPAHA